MSRSISRIAVASSLALGLSCSAHATADPGPSPDLSLEDLLKADVVTASRKSQAVQDVAAAVFVITHEDIERSGATSLPEALRLAPGVEVARMSSGHWAVSIRGFNGRFANKLLVLMDGRSIYSPFFSGVQWEIEGTLLEDIDRIEVIRGPGSALWGSNAVNGVINIITRNARDTQGTMISAGTGNIDRAVGAARYGANLPQGHYRLWAQGGSQRSFDDSTGTPGNDDSHSTRAGFRADTTVPNGDSLTLSGSLADTVVNARWYEPSLLSPTGIDAQNHSQHSNAAHVLARYSRLGSDGSETVVQAYTAHSEVQIAGTVGERRTTIDFEVQHRPRLHGVHDVVCGVTYRTSLDDFANGNTVVFTPAQRTFTLASTFINDEIALVPDRLHATLGVRLEHNNFTGFEPQPQARLAWTPTRTQTFWTAVSRAVRTPSRAELDTSFDVSVVPANPPVPAVLMRNTATGPNQLQSEKVTVFEWGYRQQVNAQLSLDIAAFHGHYADLIGSQEDTQQFDLQPVPHVLQTFTRTNNLAGRTQGWEMALDWRPTQTWRLQATYSGLDVQVDAPATDPVAVGYAALGSHSAPRQQWMLRSSLSLGHRDELDMRLRHVSATQQDSPNLTPIPAYSAFDLRYAIHPTRGLTLSIVGENLLLNRHPEFTSDSLPLQQLQVPRSVFVKANWQF